MNREQLAHVVRAAATIVGDGDIVILGSQSILATYDESRLPDEATMSVEADLAFRDDPEAAKADRVDGAIGELSPFHETHGYYARVSRSRPPSFPPAGRTDSNCSSARIPTRATPAASNRTTSSSPSSSPDARRTSRSRRPSSRTILSTLRS